jgi:DNA-binding transcriptional LysR family regulator
MNLKQLEHLLAVAQTGSFSKAAEQLHLTQPALSRSIRLLEDTLQARLIDRMGRKNELTALGEAVATRARQLLLEAEEIQRTVGLLKSGALGPVNIGLGSGPAAVLTNPLMRHVARHHPDLTLTVTRGPIEQQMRQLRERSIDALVIDLRSVIPAPDLLIEPVAELRGGFICRHGHPLVQKSKAKVKIKDVLKYPIATTNLADEVIRLLQEHFGTQISFVQAIRLRSEDISSLIEAVRETDAVFFGVVAAARVGISDKSLIELSIKPPLDIGAPFGIVSLAGRSQSAAMGIVSSFIRDHLHD